MCPDTTLETATFQSADANTCLQLWWCSDIYCAQLFEDLQNKIDEGSFVSVKLESISALADNLQTEVEGALKRCSNL